VAIYIAEFARGRTREILKVLVELLAAIPSVVWGFIGLMMMNPLIIDVFDVPWASASSTPASSSG
jgi:phosphate transport system permease protein